MNTGMDRASWYTTGKHVSGSISYGPMIARSLDLWIQRWVKLYSSLEYLFIAIRAILQTNFLYGSTGAGVRREALAALIGHFLRRNRDRFPGTTTRAATSCVFALFFLEWGSIFKRLESPSIVFRLALGDEVPQTF
ncbi:uncharacterized protein BP01DRAFT_186163 [Aspergillus saccharolyticus JOP 1030-1]|uniref:Uncharacterized protein n=1 Tax=Aspergillus saccharolyticus JOP 1030-1 TaxID=1450539 RepID=A0A318Z474_9EURO|nr:hypothetical protein BP01DRAFT_186163 [Aspergillus saccharolyticus JOP 1030-1]PYH41127.1 hypothetical protein BP01DRAFT_186163 [Aspergillus saccharolyticus JOP 1030-1]